jgi:hypothetical protein
MYGITCLPKENLIIIVCKQHKIVIDYILRVVFDGISKSVK